MSSHPRVPRIYFIKPVGQDGPIKIGFSNFDKARLGAMMSWSPVPLEIIASVPGSLALEKQVHDCFADCHSHREWFRAEPQLLDFIQKVKSGIAIADAVDLSRPVGNVRSLKILSALARKGTPEETFAL